jgi:L-iditol 2-dehydrogenase
MTPSLPLPLPESMLAARLHAPGDLRVDRVPLPHLDEGDVLLRVLATGVCATDRKLVARGTPGAAARTLGHEIVAEVVAPGGTATPAGRLPPGTRVAVAPNVGEGSCPACLRGATNLCPEFRAFGIHLDGGMAEYMRVPRVAVEAGHLLPLPTGMSDLDAVLLEPLACCVEGLEASELRPGESLLVIAAGVMGRLHVVAARALGAGTVIVVDRSRERLAHARALGADLTLEANDDVSAAVKAATDGHGVDVAAITIGDAPAVQAALTCLAGGGRLNLFAGFSGDERQLSVDANDIHYRGLRLVGTTGASKPTLVRTLSLLHRGRPTLSGMVSAVYRLDDAPRAFAAAGEIGHARVVLTPSASVP